MYYSTIYLKDIETASRAIPNIEFLKNKSILVTGGCVLIGSAVIDMLLSCNGLFGLGASISVGARNWQVYEERFKGSPYFRDCGFEQYDALKRLKLSQDFDFIIHMANMSNPALYDQKPVETIYSIYEGTKNVLEYAARKSSCRVLYISSSEIYGANESGNPYEEGDYGYFDILNPRACYPSGKRVAETLCSAYAKEYDVDIVIARPGHVYGPTAKKGDNRVSSMFFYEAFEGKDLVLKSSGTQIRSYCYVPDCASAILTILLKGGSGEAYNISNVSSICTIRELVEEIAKVSERKVVFTKATDAERKNFNLMENASLRSDRLEQLGWKGNFELAIGVKHTYEIIRERIKK